MPPNAASVRRAGMGVARERAEDSSAPRPGDRYATQPYEAVPGARRRCKTQRLRGRPTEPLRHQGVPQSATAAGRRSRPGSPHGSAQQRAPTTSAMPKGHDLWVAGPAVSGPVPYRQMLTAKNVNKSATVLGNSRRIAVLIRPAVRGSASAGLRGLTAPHTRERALDLRGATSFRPPTDAPGGRLLSCMTRVVRGAPTSCGLCSVFPRSQQWPLSVRAGLGVAPKSCRWLVSFGRVGARRR